ncbi:centrosomal protein of 57 kDa isoform X2 [Nematostella vectensis]|uniref:centrosomal protein of 57 kDa isoform X2 n=1 Tax=Nematostella vectensis TaxID=45351 RepID=UPI0020772E45|nr:centrosomal protein of 57 kDa isoform X2 [Nematostella vectensis]
MEDRDVGPNPSIFGTYSPHRSSIRSVANSSISSYQDFPRTTVYRSEGMATPKGPNVPQTNSRAVISALKGLQEKIRKLELERTDAEDNLKRLAAESKHYKEVLQKEQTVRSVNTGVISKQNEALQDDLHAAEARCNLLEKQLDYMRKMVHSAEHDRDTAVQRSAVLAQQITQQSAEEIKGQLGKLTGLEREHMKLTASHSLAEGKIRDLEERLRDEAHHRKLLEDRTAQTAAETNRIMMTALTPPSPKHKKKKKKKLKAKPIRRPPEPQGHYRLNLGTIPFVVGKSASKSHSVGANIQQALHLLKGHNPPLCDAVSRVQRQHRRPASVTSSSDSDSGLEELLHGLQDEFGHMSFEHQELVRQINDTLEPRLREDLERELEQLVAKMEAKGEQIAMVKRQQTKHNAPQKRLQARPRSAVRPKSTSAVIPSHGGQVEIITTVKTKGAKTEVGNRIESRPGVKANEKRKVLQGMKNLQSSLTKDDLHWD